MSEAIVETHQDWLAPVTTVQNMLAAYQQMQDFVSQALKKELDFGTIPGTNKPTLLKPGAEKLCKFWGLKPTFDDVEVIQDWTGSEHDDEPFFYYRQRCNLWRGDTKVADAEGSANSWEKKYRWRQPERACPRCGRNAIILGKEEYGGGWLCWKKKGGCGKKFKIGDSAIEGQQLEPIPNPDIHDTPNTILKMAQKRAFVAVTLLAVNGSDYFTQDVEDISFGDGSNHIEGQFKEVQDPKPTPEVIIEELGYDPPGTVHVPANAEHADDHAGYMMTVEKTIKPAPKKANGRTWPGELVTALVDVDAAEHPKQAVAILNFSNLDPNTATVENAAVFGKLWRGWRDSDKTKEEAAELANAGKAP